MTVDSIFSQLTDYEMYITSQYDGFTQYYASYGMWAGTLSSLDVKGMYMLKLGTESDGDISTSLVVTGDPVDVASTPISYIDGWNWISYLPQNAGNVQEALATVSAAATASDNLYITSQSDGFIQYYPAYGAWAGTLGDMNPGAGYMMSTSYAGDLVYPVDALAKVTENNNKIDLPVTISNWNVNYADYQFIGSITASIDSREDYDGDLSLIHI